MMKVKTNQIKEEFFILYHAERHLLFPCRKKKNERMKMKNEKASLFFSASNKCESLYCTTVMTDHIPPYT